MKRIIKSLAIAAVSALAFISCSQEQNPVSNDNGIHFTIRTSENPQVKSFIDNNLNGTYTPKWSKGDELAMFVGTIDGNTKKATGILTNTKEEDLTATFDGTVTGLPEKGTFKSFAPASAFAETCYNSGNVGVTLKDVQNPSSLTIDEACDILVAKETSYTADAAGEVAIDDLFFKRMFSVVKVALKGPASLNGEKVSKFSLTAPEGTVLTGRAAINLSSATIDKWNISNNTVTATYTTDAPGFGGEYPGLDNVVWFVVNPGTIESGAKVVFAGETANYTFSKEVTLSKALTFPESQLAVINLTLAEENCTKKEVPAPASWIATDLADITATDEVVITMAKDSKVYALTSAKGSSDAPTAVAVTVENRELKAAPADNLVWNVANADGNLTIYPKGQTDTWLYTTNDNNGVRVGKNENKTFVVDSKSGYLKNTTTSRYLGVYNNSDWRCYTSTSTNIGGQTLCFYVKGGPIDNTRPTLSVDQNSKVWAADATDAFVVKVTVNSEGGDWTVTPETLSWAKVAVDKAAGTITVTPNGANEKESANEATLTVAHASAASLTKEISLKQNGKGGAAGPTTVTKTMDSIVTENSYTISSGNNYGTIQKTLKIDDVIELSSTGGGNTGSFWGTAPDIDWRCYEATNSVVKISAKDGYLIDKFTLTFKIGNGGTLDGGKIKSGTEYTVNAQSVSYKIGHTGKKNGQIRITAISVTYKQK